MVALSSYLALAIAQDVSYFGWMTNNEKAILSQLNDKRHNYNTETILPFFLGMPVNEFRAAVASLKSTGFIYEEQGVLKIHQTGEGVVNGANFFQSTISSPDYGDIAKQIVQGQPQDVSDLLKAYQDKSPIKGYSFYFNIALAVDSVTAVKPIEQVNKVMLKAHCINEAEKIKGEPDRQRKERKHERRFALLLAAISGIVGTVLGGYQSGCQADRQAQRDAGKHDSLRIQVVHDTVLLNVRRDISDTSLVRLVKLPPPTIKNKTP